MWKPFALSVMLIASTVYSMPQEHYRVENHNVHNPLMSMLESGEEFLSELFESAKTTPTTSNLVTWIYSPSDLPQPLPTTPIIPEIVESEIQEDSKTLGKYNGLPAKIEEKSTINVSETYIASLEIVDNVIQRLKTESKRIADQYQTALNIRDKLKAKNLQDLKESEICPIWVPASYGEIPVGALISGIENKGQDNEKKVYVARAVFNTSLIPGKVVTGHLAAYVGYGPWEMSLFNYEVLVSSPNNLEWMNYKLQDANKLSNYPLIGGIDANGNPILIGRTSFKNPDDWYGEANIEAGAFYPGRAELEITYKYRSYIQTGDIQILTLLTKSGCENPS